MKTKMKNEKKEALGIKEFVYKRKKKGLYTLVFVAGLPGSGKSYSCIRLGEIITKMLTGENKFKHHNVFDNFVNLVQFVKGANPNEVNVGVIEEASVLFPSRRAMARENVDVNRVLDTARKKQVVLLANAPLWPSIDSHMRSLGNFYLETLAINKRDNKVIAKPLILQTNPRSGKTYYHRPTVNGREVHRTWIGKPDEAIIEKYEDRKNKFLDKIYEKAIYRKQKKNKELQKEMEKLRNQEKGIHNELTEKQKEVLELWRRGITKQKEVAKRAEVTQSSISRRYKLMRKKGYYPQDYE